MKLLVYSANLGNFDRPKEHEEQILPEGIDLIEYWRCTDDDFSPRYNAMTPRLQARIVKMFGWQMKPDYDIYLWVDSSCRLPKEDSVKWFMEQMGDKDMAVFKHNKRETVLDEVNYLVLRRQQEKLNLKLPYVVPRYDNEDANGILREVDRFRQLYASTAFIYCNKPEVQEAMKEYWYYTSRYHSIDQLGFPEAIKDIPHNVIDENYLKCDYLQYTRK